LSDGGRRLGSGVRHRGWGCVADARCDGARRLPYIKLKPGYRTPVTRDTRIRLFSRGCGSLVYTWETSPAVSGLTTNKRDLIIPAGLLTGGVTYTATVTASLLADPAQYVSKSTLVSVVSRPLEAKMKGPGSVGACSGKHIQIETSVSDPDGSSDPLQYSWSSPCPALALSLAGSTASMTILGDLVGAGNRCEIFCKVTKGTRSITVRQVVEGVGSSPPTAIIMSSAPIGNPQRPHDSFKIMATPTSACGALTYHWDAGSLVVVAKHQSAEQELVFANGAAPGQYSVSVKVCCKCGVCSGRVTADFIIYPNPTPPPGGLPGLQPPPGGLPGLQGLSGSLASLASTGDLSQLSSGANAAPAGANPPPGDFASPPPTPPYGSERAADAAALLR